MDRSSGFSFPPLRGQRISASYMIVVLKYPINMSFVQKGGVVKMAAME